MSPRLLFRTGSRSQPARNHRQPWTTSGVVLLAVFLGWSGWLLHPSPAQSAEDSAVGRPNIVVLIADDHSVRDASVYGAEDIPTPHLDRLARRGLVFDRAFVNSPSCAPSRAALFTSLYPAKNGAESNHARVHPQLKRLPAFLKELGYEVVSFGKVSHYGHVTEQGFDLAQNYTYHDHEGVQASIDYLKERRSDKPLALFFGTNWPHVPLPLAESILPEAVQVPPMHLDTPEYRQYRARYVNAVKKMDEEIGAVYAAALQYLGSESTFFLQTSDHGAQLPFGKWNLYDEGIRVPLIAQWSGRIQPGKRTSAMVQWIDILPTLIEVAGGAVPEGLDGQSFLPVLLGQTQTHRQAIFTTHSNDNDMNVYPMRSMRSERWKYIRNLHPEFRFTSHIDRSAAEDSLAYMRSWEKLAESQPRAAEIVQRYRQRPSEELYDLHADPYELHNLAAVPDHSAQLEWMRTELSQWLNQIGDQQLVRGQPLLLTDPFQIQPRRNPTRTSQTSNERPNVLLLLVDDLKPTLGCYGDLVAQTPHMDALARRSMRFDLAYCNQAVCAPSRFTLMLGSHSTSTGLYGLGSQLRQALPDAVTMPQYFARRGGYHTESLGKVFHVGHGNHGDPDSFNVPHFHDKVIEYLDPTSTHGGLLTREEAYFTNQKLGEINSLPRGAAFEWPDVDDQQYADGRVAAEAVRRLEAAKKRRLQDGKPFFIAVGFARPHLPFCVPRKYWDRFDPSALPMPPSEQLPSGAPAVAGKRGGEIANYHPVPAGQGQAITDDLKRQLIHGYYASTSYVDAQIGKVLAQLDHLELSDNTIVVLWGDHGFHLGDLGIWTKHTNYEQANRIPLLICAPGVAAGGASTKQLAESVDIFPTLAELAGLPPPTGPQPIDGISLVGVLKEPDRRLRDYAYHVYPKQSLGRAIRTERYRLVEWLEIGAQAQSAQYELYDYQTDPLESRNLAAERPDIVAQLKQKLAGHRPPVVSSANVPRGR